MVEKIIKKIIENIKRIELNYSILSCLIIILVVHFISAGYSSFVTSLSINDVSAKVRANYALRVTDFKIKELSDKTISYYEEYDVENLYTSVKLPTIDSYAIYDVEVSNYNIAEAGILSIDFENEFLDYEIINYTLQDEICDDNDSEKCSFGAKKTFQIKLKYKDNIQEPQDTQDITFDIWFSYMVDVTYYGIDSTNLKNKVIRGGDFTEKIDVDPSRLKVSIGWGETSINTSEWATYNDGVLYLKEISGPIKIYNFLPLEIKVEEEYKPDNNDEIDYTYEITNRNSFDISYFITPKTNNLGIQNNSIEIIEANETITKSKKIHVNSFGESALKYLIIEPFYDTFEVDIKIKDRNVKYLYWEKFFMEPDSAFLGGPIKRKDIESVSFLGVTSIPENALGSFDVSYVSGTKTTWAWYFDNDNNGLYEFYISYFGDSEGKERMVNIKNADSLFAAMTNLKQINFSDENGINRFNTEDNDRFFRTFYNCKSIKKIDFSGLDTRNNTTLYETFRYCYALEELNISNMDTSNVVITWRTFEYCYKLKSIDLSNFNTSKITNMGDMFKDCINLTELNLSNFDTSNVETMSGVFRGCTSLTNIDLSNFDTSSVTDFSGIFYNAPHINTTLTIKSNNFSYTTNPFTSTATDGTSKVTINYTAENKEKVEEMINGKSANSNVVLGEEVI